jgi:hypothetical protein
MSPASVSAFRASTPAATRPTVSRALERPPPSQAELLLVREVGVRRPELRAHLLVVAAALILVAHHHGDGRAEGDAVVNAREDLDGVGLAPLRRDVALARPAAIELALNLLDGDGQPRRAAVDDDAHGGSVGLAEGRDAKRGPEGISRHFAWFLRRGFLRRASARRHRPGRISIMPW